VRAASLAVLVGRDLVRTRGALATGGFGIAAATAALSFFLALGLGVRAVLLGDVFPADRVELEPPKAADPGLVGLLLPQSWPGISKEQVDALRSLPDAKNVYPKLRFAFPASARGGRSVLGRDVGTSELPGDGIEPSLVAGELPEGAPPFEDPLLRATVKCGGQGDCREDQFCEKVPGKDEGLCCDPVPVLVSRYLVELFDKSMAPAHKLPPIGETIVSRAHRVVFDVRLGDSLIGKAKTGEPRVVKGRLIGISKRAIDLGVTIPIDVVRRYNREYAGDDAADKLTSVVVEAKSSADTAAIVARAQALGLEPKDTHARDVSLLLSGMMALLSLVAGVIFVVSASNIAHSFRSLVDERRAEIALYRAVGASAADMRAWVLSLAVVVGVGGGAVGLAVARLVAYLADRLAAEKLPDFPFKPETFFVFPGWLLAGSMLFAAGFALLGAVAPARRASRVDPMHVLAER
jgi:hypothetical protein